MMHPVSSKPSIKVFFRYDDFSAVSDDTVDRGLVETFGRHSLSCTFAVIPRVTEGNYRDPEPRECLELPAEKQELLRNAVALGIIDVALHGLIHRSNGLGMPHSEFRGLDLAAQSNKIRDGKALLESIIGKPIIAFVPPWNTYDDQPLKALHANGIACLSANRFGPLTRATPRMKFVPITAELGELNCAIDCARRSGDPDPVVGILMHPYDFRESGDPRAREDLSELDSKLSWLLRQQDVAPTNVSALTKMQISLDLRRYQANRPLKLEAVAPPGVPAVVDIPYYASTSPARNRRLKCLTITAITHLMAGLTGLCVGFLAGRTLVSFGALLTVALLLTLCTPWVFLVSRARRQNGIYFRSMFLLMGLSGAIVGMFSTLISRF